MTPAGRRLLWAASVLVTIVVTLFVPCRLTDGDSCAYAAMAHDMARGGSWAAPAWDFHGAEACFHEHPPGVFWASALLERLGAPAETAALAANALWTFAAAAGVIALARVFVSKATADFAGLVFLLHVAVMRYVQRASLEIPLAATASWTLAAGLRLGRSRWWIAAAGAALAGTFLVRGVFGAVPAAMLVHLAIDRPLRPPLARLAGTFVVGAAALFAFDRWHAAAAGHGFWAAYVERQVLPSLQPGGTPHAVEGGTWTYYAGRMLLYSLPWSLLPVWRILRGPRPVAAPHAWRLAAIWILVVAAGASLTSRAGSRYLFQAYVATSLLAALALSREPGAVLARTISTLLLAAVPVQIALKSAFHERDAWRATADACASLRGDPRIAGRVIHGPFQPEDDRLKSLLRFHLGLAVSSAPAAESAGLRWIPGGEPSAGRVVLSTPLGALVDVR